MLPVYVCHLPYVHFVLHTLYTPYGGHGKWLAVVGQYSLHRVVSNSSVAVSDTSGARFCDFESLASRETQTRQLRYLEGKE